MKNYLKTSQSLNQNKCSTKVSRFFAEWDLDFDAGIQNLSLFELITRFSFAFPWLQIREINSTIEESQHSWSRTHTSNDDFPHGHLEEFKIIESGGVEILFDLASKNGIDDEVTYVDAGHLYVSLDSKEEFSISLCIWPDFFSKSSPCIMDLEVATSNAEKLKTALMKIEESLKCKITHFESETYQEIKRYGVLG